MQNIWRLHEDFARLRKFRKGLWNSSVSQGLWNSFWLAKIWQGVAKFILSFTRLAKFFLGQFASLRIFRKGLRNSWMIDFFFVSLPCILDCFGKGFEALHNLNFSCTLASILLCHGLYQVLHHYWLVLMIKNLSKTPKRAKN